MRSEIDSSGWLWLNDVTDLPSPSLLVYRERVEDNLKRMVLMAEGPGRLRPHIKTHKMRELIGLQLELGITKFKCATVAEAEMAADAGAPDLLLAYPPVGPLARRVVDLLRTFPNSKFAVIADDPVTIRHLSKIMESCSGTSTTKPQQEVALEVLVDLDVGQHRTGIPVGASALELYRLIASLPGLRPGGLHAYDGQI